MEWTRVGDDMYWMEAAKDGGKAHLRAPVGVIEVLMRWATRENYVPRKHFDRTEEEDGKVVHLTGTEEEMKKLIHLAREGGPGPLLRLVLE